jgi:hypothetical protein
MEFINHTPFPAIAFDGLDQRDARFHIVVMRLTFDIQNDGTLAFSEAPTPLVATDEYYGELNESSVRQESDFAPYKPHTDIIVLANAYAPSRQPKARFNVGVSITGAPTRQEILPLPFGLNPLQGPSHEQMEAWRNERDRIESAPPNVATIFDKKLIVTGPREWRKRNLVTRVLSLFTLPKWKLTSPTPITDLPLRYEYAYGGDNKILVTEKAAKRVKKKYRLPGRLPQSAKSYAGSDQEIPAIAHSVSQKNTVGRGFAEAWYLRATKAKRIAAPQIEAPDEPIARLGQAYTPRGLGVITRAWQPRLPLAGTYDKAWLDHRHPYLPADFNFAYWNAAPGDQQVVPHLTGDETVVLTNLCPPGTPGSTTDSAGNSQLKFTLPGHLPFVLVRFVAGEIGELAAKLDTLIIDTAPDANNPDKKPTVVCVWRATVASAPAVRVLEARMLGKHDVEVLREQAKQPPQTTALHRQPVAGTYQQLAAQPLSSISA